MKNKIKQLSTLFLSAILTMALTACGDKDDTDKAAAKKIEGRWYTNAQLIRGKKVFVTNCAACHGASGEGLVVDWKKPGADGKFPAPPLNGSAHTWHHSKALLMRTINEGGVALGGAMPPFKDKLTEQEKEAVLAYVMSLWPKDIYATWQERNPATM